MKTDNTQEERRNRYYERQQRRGLVRIQLWVPRPYRGELEAFAKQLREQFFKLWGKDNASNGDIH